MEESCAHLLALDLDCASSNMSMDKVKQLALVMASNSMDVRPEVGYECSCDTKQHVSQNNPKCKIISVKKLLVSHILVV